MNKKKFIAQLDTYHREFLKQPMDNSHISNTIVDTGHALVGIELFIDFIKDNEISIPEYIPISWLKDRAWDSNIPIDLQESCIDVLELWKDREH